MQWEGISTSNVNSHSHGGREDTFDGIGNRFQNHVMSLIVSAKLKGLSTIIKDMDQILVIILAERTPSSLLFLPLKEIAVMWQCV